MSGVVRKLVDEKPHIVFKAGKLRIYTLAHRRATVLKPCLKIMAESYSSIPIPTLDVTSTAPRG